MEELIREAIQNRFRLGFVYDGLKRIADPHAFGVTTRGFRAVQCWQSDGASQGGNLPGWRMFRIDEISQMQIIKDHFSPQEDFNDSNFDEVFITI